jgi:hypothetical protein
VEIAKSLNVGTFRLRRQSSALVTGTIAYVAIGLLLRIATEEASFDGRQGPQFGSHAAD